LIRCSESLGTLAGVISFQIKAKRSPV